VHGAEAGQAERAKGRTQHQADIRASTLWKKKLAG